MAFNILVVLLWTKWICIQFALGYVALHLPAGFLDTASRRVSSAQNEGQRSWRTECPSYTMEWPGTWLQEPGLCSLLRICQVKQQVLILCPLHSQQPWFLQSNHVKEAEDTWVSSFSTQKLCICKVSNMLWRNSTLIYLFREYYLGFHLET